MKISFLEIAGFRGAKDRIRLTFPSGFVVICGRNGSGKSTLCDAIEYALRGEIDKSYLYEKEKGETAADYVWWRGKKKASDHYVAVGLLGDDGNELIIKRGPEGLLKPMNSEQIASALCHVESSPDDCITHLCRGTIIRDEMITNLSVDMPEVDRFKFVKATVTTSNFETLEERSKEVRDTLSEKSNVLKSQYAELRNQITALMAERSKIQAELVQEQDIAQARHELQQIMDKPLEDLSSILSSGRNLLVELRAQVDGLTRLLELLQDLTKLRREIETEKFKEQISALQQKVQMLETQLSDMERRDRQLNGEIEAQARMQPRLRSLAELISHGKSIGLVESHCPLCGLKISEGDYLRHIEELEITIQGQATDMTKLVDERTQISLGIKNLHAELSQERINLANLSSASASIIARLEQIREEMAKYGISSDSAISISAELIVKEIFIRREKISGIEKNISTLEISKAVEKTVSIGRDISVAQKAALECEKQLERCERAKARADSLYSAIRRIAGEIVDEQLAALSPLFSEFYFRLRPHIDWPEVKYHIRGDVRRFLSLRVGHELNLRFMFSSGQRRATGLAFLLAVNQSLGWSKLKTLILDDPVQHIDDYRALHLAELLAAIRLSHQQVVCTVEDSALAELLCRRLRSSEREEGILINMEYAPGDGVSVVSEQKIYPTPREVLLSA